MRASETITCNGQTMTLADWARKIGVKRETLWVRLHKRKWTVEEALGFIERPKREGKFWPGDRSRITPEQAAIRYHFKGSKRTLTPTYRSWLGMKNRCNNTRSQDYSNYGGRGIFVCNEWIHSFDAFYADMGECPRGYSIDRIDNDGPYSKENCRWASRAVQNNNQRKNRVIEHDGQRLTLAQWCRELGIDVGKVLGRIHRCKWSEKEALGLICRTKAKRHDG